MCYLPKILLKITQLSGVEVATQNLSKNTAVRSSNPGKIYKIFINHFFFLSFIALKIKQHNKKKYTLIM